MDYGILKSELADDPLGRGYSGMDHALVATDLNTTYRERNVESVAAQQVFEAVARSDFTALTDAQKALLYAIIGMGEILVNGTNTRAALLSMFEAESETRANLVVLQKQAISRAAELGLETVYAGTVQRARAI